MADERSRGPVGTSHAPWPEWARHYRKSWLKPDVIAGLTSAAVVIPKALAYATVAGLPVQVGLYTAFTPMVIYALFGASRPLSVSTTTTLAILAVAALNQVASGGAPADLAIATASLTLLVGAILALASLLRLGFLANFISEPVLTGFKAGIAIVIVVDQIPKLIGIHLDKGSFVHTLLAIAQGVPHASVITILVGGLTLAALLGFERFLPRLPAPLAAVACAIAATSLFGLATRGVSTVGYVPTGLPSLTVPDLSLLAQLWPFALGIALMSFTETIAAGRAFVQDNEPTPRANRELFATGLANLGGSLLGAMPAGGGTTQTAVNRRSGARSQLAGLVTAAVALGVMLLLAPFIGLIPHATLAAIVIAYSIGLFSVAEFRAILAVRRTELIWAIVALAGVVLLGTLQGILVAIVVSLVALAHQVSDPPVHELVRKRGSNVFRPVTAAHSDDESFPGLLIVRLESRLFFANAENVAQKIRARMAASKPEIVAIDFGGVFDIEYTALRMLINAEKKCAQPGCCYGQWLSTRVCWRWCNVHRLAKRWDMGGCSIRSSRRSPDIRKPPDVLRRTIIRRVTMADLIIANIEDGTTDDEIRDFLVRYGFPAFDRIQQVPGTGFRPAVLVIFDGLDPDALRNLQDRIHNIVWKGRTITARIVRDRADE